MFGWFYDIVREITGESQRDRETRAAFERQWRVADMAWGKKPYPDLQTCSAAERGEAKDARRLRAEADSAAVPPSTSGMTPLQIAEAERDYYRKRSNEPANPIAMREFRLKADTFEQMAQELRAH